jgi:hypothetical protein
VERQNSNYLAMLAAVLGALAVAAPVAIRSASPTHVPTENLTATDTRNLRVPDSRMRPYRVLRDFLGLTDEEAYTEWVAPNDPRSNYTIKFLIATLPEPLAPSFQYKFDTYLDSLQKAAQSAGFILDRFDLPWTDPNQGRSSAFRLGQEIDLNWATPIEGQSPEIASIRPNTKSENASQNEPGVLLFRSVVPGRKELLLVLLVGETPVWGIRKDALASSLDWVAWLSEPWGTQDLPLRFPRRHDSGRLKIRIMGPSFSGSAISMRLTIDGWLASHKISPDPYMQIVSGTATSIPSGNKGTFGKYDYSTTAINASEKNQLTNAYLETELGAQLDRIAVFSESGTSSGNSREIFRKSRENSASRPGPAPTSDFSRHPLILKFPLHISNLRSVSRATDTQTAPQLELVRKNLSFSEEQSGSGAYVVPMFSPRSTTYDELVLDKLLESISAARMDYVRIDATDVEDLIFLAQQVKSKCSNVVLVTSTADLRFLHSDINSDLRGMLVVSTYPLFVENQSWSYSVSQQNEKKREEFPSENAEGVYNATLALLERTDLMLDYRLPFSPYSERPPLWVSIVGNDNFWPVAVLGGEDYSDYLIPGEGSSPSAIPPLPSAMYPRQFLFVLVVLSLFSGGTSALLIRGDPTIRVSFFDRLLNWSSHSLPRSLSIFSAEAVDSQSRPARRTILFEYALLLLLAEGIMFAFLILPMSTWTAFGQGYLTWKLSPLVKFLVLPVSSIAVVLAILAVIVTFSRAMTGPASSWRKAGVFLILAIATAAAASVAMLIDVQPKAWQTATAVRTFLFLRSVNLGNDVSPLVPILLVAGAGLLLVICSLLRLSLLEECPLPKPFLNFCDESFEGVSALESRIRHQLECNPLTLPGSRVLLPLFGGVV